MQATITSGESALNITENNPLSPLFNFPDKKDGDMNNSMDYQLQASNSSLDYPYTIKGGKVFANITKMMPGKLYGVDYKKRKYLMKRDESGRLDVYELVK